MILICSPGDRLSIKAMAASIELILVEGYAMEDMVENAKIVHRVGPCIS